jgi:hypothetical protein
MSDTLHCIFQGNTALVGSATRLPDGLYQPTVIQTTRVTGERVVRTRQIAHRRFRTFDAAAVFGLDYVWPADLGFAGGDESGFSAHPGQTQAA